MLFPVEDAPELVELVAERGRGIAGELFEFFDKVGLIVVIVVNVWPEIFRR